MVGLFRLERLRRRPRHRVQRDPRGRRADRRLAALQVHRVAGPTRCAWSTGSITRDATKLPVGGVIYTPWCDENGKVVDDGTIHRLDERRYRWTAADPQLRWLRQNSARARRHDRRGDRGDRRARPPGPAVARRPRGGDRRVVRRPALLPPPRRRRSARSRSTSRGPATPATSATSCGSRRASAVKVWDALIGGRRAVRHPAGGDARARRRPPRGRPDPARGRLHVGAPRDEPRAELLARSRSGSAASSTSTRAATSSGGCALEREARAGGPARRLVGLQLDWYDIEGLYDAQGLPPAISPSVDRDPVPVFAGGRQVGRATSHGWSPILKQAIALASVSPEHEALGTRLSVEWTVEGRRGRVGASVVELPFLDLERKRA